MKGFSLKCLLVASAKPLRKISGGDHSLKNYFHFFHTLYLWYVTKKGHKQWENTKGLKFVSPIAASLKCEKSHLRPGDIACSSRWLKMEPKWNWHRILTRTSHPIAWNFRPLICSETGCFWWWWKWRWWPFCQIELSSDSEPLSPMWRPKS